MKHTIFTISIALALLASACSNEKFATDNGDYDKTYLRLQFLHTGDSCANNFTSITRGNQTSVVTGDLKDQYVVAICMWNEFGRASQNCQGFGLCGFMWEPYGKALDKVITDSSSEYRYNGMITKFHDGNLKMLMLLVTKYDETNTPILYIDEDIAGTPLETGFKDENGYSIKGCPDEIVLKKGKYTYDPSLGTFGGYAVDVEAFYHKQ